MKKIIPLIILLSALACTKPPPSILIIGDSISIGYTPFVKDLLGENAIVVHNEGNAQHTGTGLEKIQDWIGGKDWDIIQFNWGLWDLAYRHEDSEEQGKRDKVNGTVTYTPEKYKANLDSLVRLIKESSSSDLLFVTTSYVPEGEAGRFAEDALIYNRAAIEVMNKHKVKVNDIYEFSRAVHEKFATAPDNVHYTEEGYKLLAEKILDGLSEVNRRIRILK